MSVVNYEYVNYGYKNKINDVFYGLIANSNIRSVVLEIKTTDVKPLK